MIPKIIHQLWDGRINPLFDSFKQMSTTWKEYHPDWHYEFWDEIKMEAFIKNYFPDMIDIYFNYKYDVQRWDLIRYLFLYKMGGMYVDFDYECLESFDDYIKDKDKCYFAMEADEHRRAFGKEIYFSNALMITPPGHPFFEFIITHLQTTSFKYSERKFHDVLSSTGPLMLTNIYEKYENKDVIGFFSPEQVSPWSQKEVLSYLEGKADKEKLYKKLGKAIAIHYFWNSWLNNDKIDNY